jgi:CubicO group peptidase (beta-lactamase class C family)
MQRRALLAAALAAPWVARAQGAGWSASFTEWAAAHGIQQGGIAAMRNGRLVHGSGFNGGSATASTHVASLSKFITGCAVARLLGQNRITLNTRLGQAMPAFFQRHGARPDDAIGQFSVGQLLTHRTGLPRSHGTPAEYLPGLRAKLAESHPRDIPLAWLEQSLLAMVPEAPRGAAYRYSNGNYLLLGRLIGEVSHVPYEAFVTREVLRPAGLQNVHVDPVWPFRDASGGWQMSAVGYLRLLRHTLLDRAWLPAPVRSWAWDPTGKTTSASGERHYAMGMLFDRTPQGMQAWHDGVSNFAYGQGATRLRLNSGSFFSVAPDGTACCAVFAPYAQDAAWAELRRRLAVPMRGAADESADDLFLQLRVAA